MKVRRDFVTNSSSSSFVLSKSGIGETYTDYILKKFCHVTTEELLKMIDDWSVFDDVYYLVDYVPEEDNITVWVRRDECMNDDYIDDILYDFDLDGKTLPNGETVRTKFYYHF